MGHLNSGLVPAAESLQLYPQGLHLYLTEAPNAKGTWKAREASTWRAGQAVMLNASREVILSDGTAVLGFAKYPKMSTGKSIIIDEAVTFGTSGATKTLAHPNISNVVVRSATGMSGTTYTVTTDYTLNTTNGTITHVPTGSGGNISAVTSPVYVSYTWDLTANDHAFEGTNFWGTQDWVTIQDGRITVIEAPATIYTVEYDTTRAYTLTSTGSNIYVNSSGIVTNNSSSAKFVGHCIKLPTAGDPWLGFEFKGELVARS